MGIFCGSSGIAVLGMADAASPDGAGLYALPHLFTERGKAAGGKSKISAVGKPAKAEVGRPQDPPLPQLSVL